MKFRAMVLSVVALAVLSATAFAGKYDDLMALSALVRAGDGTGTGVLVTKQDGDVTRTFIWTAGHVVLGNLQPDGTFKNLIIYNEYRENGRLVGKSMVEAKVVAYSDPEEGEDLALLEVLQDNFRPLTVSAKFAKEGIQEVGTSLVHVGCTLGLYNSVSEGIISQTDREMGGKMFDQTSCIGYPGSSGGGVYLQETRECIGLLTRGAGPGLNFIVPMRRIIPWARQMGVLWAIDPDFPLPSEEERISLPLHDGTLTIPEPDGELIIGEGGDDESGDEGNDPAGAEARDDAVILYGRYHLRTRTRDFFRRSVG